MRTKTLFVILIITILVAGAAYYAVRTRGQEGKGETAQLGKLFPDLKEKLNEIDTILIKSPDLTIQVAKKNDHWVVPDKFDHTANFKNIKQNLTALADLTKVEAKTKKKENFQSLGVDAPSDPSSKAVQFIAKIQGENGQEVVNLIIGSKVPGTKDGHFVRLNGDDQVWLAKGDLKIVPDQKEWLDTEIFSIDKSRVYLIEFKPLEGPVFKIWRDDQTKTSFQIQPVPEGRKIKSPYTIDMISKGLMDLSFLDILPKERIAFPQEPLATFKTFDGLVVDVYLGKAHKEPQDEQIEAKSSKEYLSKAPGGKAESNDWLYFRARIDEEQQKKYVEKGKGEKFNLPEEVTRINERTEKWAYHLPNYKLEILKRNLESMLEPLKKENSPQEPEKKNKEKKKK